MQHKFETVSHFTSHVDILNPMLPSTYSEVICGGREFRYYVYNIRTIKSTDNTGEIWLCVYFQCKWILRIYFRLETFTFIWLWTAIEKNISRCVNLTCIGSEGYYLFQFSSIDRFKDKFVMVNYLYELLEKKKLG